MISDIIRKMNTILFHTQNTHKYTLDKNISV